MADDMATACLPHGLVVKRPCHQKVHPLGSIGIPPHAYLESCCCAPGHTEQTKNHQLPRNQPNHESGRNQTLDLLLMVSSTAFSCGLKDLIWPIQPTVIPVEAEPKWVDHDPCSLPQLPNNVPRNRAPPSAKPHRTNPVCFFPWMLKDSQQFHSVSFLFTSFALQNQLSICSLINPPSRPWLGRLSVEG